MKQSKFCVDIQLLFAVFLLWILQLTVNDVVEESDRAN